MVPLVFGAALSALPYRGHDRRGRYYLWFFLGSAPCSISFSLSAQYVTPGCALGTRVLLSALAILSSGFFGLFRCTRSTVVRIAESIAAASFCLLIVDVAHDRLRSELAYVGFVRGPVEPYWFGASTLVDDPGRPHRFAVTSGPWVMADNWFVYPFLGRKLQNEALYVSTAGDGSIHHFGSPAINEEYSRAADFTSWLARLRRARATHVMSFSASSIELGWMESHPGALYEVERRCGGLGAFRPRSSPSGIAQPVGTPAWEGQHAKTRQRDCRGEHAPPEAARPELKPHAVLARRHIYTLNQTVCPNDRSGCFRRVSLPILER